MSLERLTLCHPDVLVEFVNGDSGTLRVLSVPPHLPPHDVRIRDEELKAHRGERPQQHHSLVAHGKEGRRAPAWIVRRVPAIGEVKCGQPETKQGLQYLCIDGPWATEISQTQLTKRKKLPGDGEVSAASSFGKKNSEKFQALGV